MFIFSHVSSAYMLNVKTNWTTWMNCSKLISSREKCQGGFSISTSCTAADRPDSEETLITGTNKHAGFCQGDTILATGFPEPLLKDNCFHLSGLPHAALCPESHLKELNYLVSDYYHTNMKHYFTFQWRRIMSNECLHSKWIGLFHITSDTIE